MSEDECDYMSDTFISEGDSRDIRPGLIHSRSLKRKHDILRKKEWSDQTNKERNKPIKVVEHENLVNGLQKPLNTDNKGYALLEKMGFKPGSGLGKEGTGRSDPIPMEIKNDRGGLGIKAALQEMREKVEKKYKDAQANAPTIEDFRSRIIVEANERQAGIDLYKSKKACYNFDIKKGLTEPMVIWFWPEKVVEDNEKEEHDEEENEDILMTVQDKLEMLTLYLRSTYFYCVWCGTCYDDDKDLRQECPGPTRIDH